MEKTLVLLLLLSPLIGFITNLSIGKKLGDSFAGIFATATVLISFLLSLFYFLQISSTGEAIVANYFQWIDLGGIRVNFELILDQLSILWLLFLTGIGALIHLYSIGYMKGDDNVPRYFSYLNLFIFFMILLVTGNNLLVMFIGWEGVGLCSYLLIGFWYKNQEFNNAAKKAFIMNRIGDLGFLIGVFILIYLFQTVDFEGLKLALSATHDTKTLSLLGLATFALFIGATGKSAQIPLYTWLPDAMAGPTPVSALIHAATMVTGGIFMITRLNFLFDLTPNIQAIIMGVGAFTALFAASIAILQNDIKKVLAYSTISQLGLMFVALGCGAYHIAVFHVITHAFFKACLFLGSGSVIHGMGGEQDIRKMGGLKAAMGITFVSFLISTLAISGIPPFAGFFSKDEIMMVAFQANPIIWAIAALASLLTAFYMFRLLFLTFNGKYRGEKSFSELHESPKSMTLPLIILAVLAVVGGAISLPFGHSWLNGFLEPVLPQIASMEHPSEGNTLLMMGVSTLIALVGLGIAYMKYISKKEIPSPDSKLRGFAKLLSNKYYVDEAYNSVFVKPIYALAKFFRDYTEKLLAGIVAGFGKVAQSLSIPASSMQTGSLGMYLFCFVLGLCFMVFFLFFGILI